MDDEQTSGEAPSLDKSDPTNASLAAQNRKVLQGLARLERMAAGGLPTPYEIANQIVNALRQDAELETPKFSEFGFSYLRQLVLEIRRPRSPIERWAPAEPDTEAGEPAEPVIEFTPVSWEEFEERINASLAKSAKKERDMTAMLDAVMEAGLLAATEKGAVAIALAKAFAGMIPDGEPMHEIPEGWAPVALAINPATGEFLTIAGPRSEPDGRVEALETMLARQIQSSLAGAVSAVREAGKRQPVYIVTGPIDEFTCEECRNVVGKRVGQSAAAVCLRNIQSACECENGCRLAITPSDDLKAEEESAE